MAEGVITRKGTLVQDGGTTPAAEFINGEQEVSVQLNNDVIAGDTLILTDTSFFGQADTIVSDFYNFSGVSFISDDGFYIGVDSDFIYGNNPRVYKLNESTKQYELFHQFDSTVQSLRASSKNAEFILISTTSSESKMFKRDATGFSEFHNFGAFNIASSRFNEDLNLFTFSYMDNSTFETVVKVYKIEELSLTELAFDINPSDLGFFQPPTLFFSSESNYFYLASAGQIFYYEINLTSSPELVKQASSISFSGFMPKVLVNNNTFYISDGPQTEIFSYSELTGELSFASLIGEEPLSYSENFLVTKSFEDSIEYFRIWKLEDPLNPTSLQNNEIKSIFSNGSDSTALFSISENTNFLIFASIIESTEETVFTYINFEVVEGAEKARNEIIPKRNLAYIKENGSKGEVKNVYSIFRL